ESDLRRTTRAVMTTTIFAARIALLSRAGRPRLAAPVWMDTAGAAALRCSGRIVVESARRARGPRRLAGLPLDSPASRRTLQRGPINQRKEGEHDEQRIENHQPAAGLESRDHRALRPGRRSPQRRLDDAHAQRWQQSSHPRADRKVMRGIEVLVVKGAI